MNGKERIAVVLRQIFTKINIITGEGIMNSIEFKLRVPENT
jgi:hypothetical protein